MSLEGINIITGFMLGVQLAEVEGDEYLIISLGIIEIIFVK